MQGVYGIVDLGALQARGWSPRPFSESLLRGGIRILQLRAKGSSARTMLDVLRELVPLVEASGAHIYCNDRPDVAVLSGAHGVHLGQDDVSIEVARSLGVKNIGLSTHNESQFLRALQARPSYIAVGPIFSTSTKPDAEPVVGLETLQRLVKRARAEAPTIPIVGIGGITKGTIESVARCGAIPAVISALLPPLFEEIEGQARELVALGQVGAG